MKTLEDDDLLYHSRHILLEEIGIEGQQRIGETSVLIVGIGGLGCPAAVYLALAGIGRLIVVDGDEVDLSNLQRQIVYRREDLDRSKAACAQRRLHDLNKGAVIDPVRERLVEGNARRIFEQADIVLDGSDNFETRHLVNRTCLELRRPLVSGAAIRFEAQASVFDFRQPGSPCYACLFPPDTKHEDEPCSRLGVFAPLTGMVGTLMAAEALKLSAQVPQGLQGRLLLIDSRKMFFRNINIPKDPGCHVCSGRK